MLRRAMAVWVLVLLGGAMPARAQIAELASPGPLASAHASLQGIANCQRCHTPGRQVDAAKCLSCHRPVADRIARKAGVHRNAGNCASCHTEHMGADADLRHFDARGFDHAIETGFRLDGGHAKVASNCAACHRQRSFLAATRACASCHANPHKPTLGADCARCHSASVPFKQARAGFDHASTRFVLTGAHREVACEKCHAGGVFKGLAFDTCAACHKTPHKTSLGACTTCHATEHWATRTVDHGRTRFPLAGLHARVACERCHPQGITRAVRFDTCSACHTNPHRASLGDDCKACHTVNGFGGAPFDHGARTPFPLADKHAALACKACHKGIGEESAMPAARKVVDFGGLTGECVSCHRDQHNGQFGMLCDACHRATTFKIAGFVHPQQREFFGGRHATVPCAKCHVRPELQFARSASPRRPARAATPKAACGQCHADVHLGQLGGQCDRCHTVDTVRFAASKFSHDDGSFPLTGRHRTLECARCHPVQAGVFPAGTGTAARVNPMPGTCTSCHADPHMGQVAGPCSRCHATETFRVVSYEHQNLESIFGIGGHARLACQRCHKKVQGQFPAGAGVALKLTGLGHACLDCH